MQIKRLAISFLFVALISVSACAQSKPRITLDEAFNSVSITAVKISPDGNSVLIGTRRGDWNNNRFRRDIWIVRQGTDSPTLLTNSGRDGSFEWSPDGKWIAFSSNRVPPVSSDTDKQGRGTQLYLIALAGGEAFPVTSLEDSVGEFVWSPDSKSIYFSTLQPQSAAQREERKKEWKDVERFRESERGDVLARLDVEEALKSTREMAFQANAKESQGETKGKTEIPQISHAKIIATLPYSVGELALSADGKMLAIKSNPPSDRIEDMEQYEVYLLATTGGEPRRLTHNHVSEGGLSWSPDGQRLFFGVHGDVDSNYEVIQRRIYSIDIADGKVQRWGMDAAGSLSDFTMATDGSLLTSVTRRTQVQIQRLQTTDGKLTTVSKWPGNYGDFSLAHESPRVAFV
jgi:Tol biopolymer transport system component